MAEFLGFGQLTRPDIGLIADGVQNLAEIYTSDQPTALRNIRLEPEVLDIIYNLSKTISREDLRAVSGLSSLLLPTLHIQDETFERINTILYVDDTYAIASEQIGRDSNPSLRGDLVRTPNVIVYNGSIQCEGVDYRTKVLGESSLYTGGENRLTSISTSRASLFNSEQYGENESNTGYFKSASYSSSVRVRRRSHVNTITVNKSTFIPRAPVKENPSHSILCYIDNGNTGSSQAINLLATKNSPLRIPCRMEKGKIKFTFTETGVFFFGYQVQPLQSRTIGQTPQFLPLSPSSQVTASNTFTLEIDITTTGYQNSYDLYLYLYLNPAKIKAIEFSGINITEFVDGKDIGLIGFNNLESLKISGSSIKILPIWLKTLSTKLRVLDLASDGDTKRTGILSYFDYRNSSEVASLSTPLYTVASYLTIPKKGGMINEAGTGWNDTKFESYVKSQVATNTSVTYPNTRVAGTDFRAFTAMRTLSLGDRFYGLNPRLDDVFPNLTSISWRGYSDRRVWPISGTPPKINNHGNIIDLYEIPLSGASGNLVDIGTSTTVSDNTINGPTHISKYKISALDLRGDEYKPTEISGGIATSNVSEWSTWFNETKSINLARSSVSINLQPAGFYWMNLQYAYLPYSGGVAFSSAVGINSPPLKTPKLVSLNIYGTSSTGPIPSLGTNPAEETAELLDVQFGGNSTMVPITENSFNYILPANFAPERPSAPHKLTTFFFNDINMNGRFRADDLKYLYELTTFDVGRAYGVWGKFPKLPIRKNPETDPRKDFYVRIQEYVNFNDLSTLDITPSNRFIARDIIQIDAWALNVSGGGCKLPQLDGLGGADSAKIQYIDLNGSLPSMYPSNWTGTNRTTGTFIADDHPFSVLSGLTPYRVNNTGDNIYYMEGGSELNGKVLVNDSVRTSASGTELARVVSVSSTRIYLDKDIPGSTPGTYYFIRQTQPIANWFAQGFTELATLRLSNCRLSGSINIRSGFSKITNSSGYACLDLSYNCLTGYTAGFDKIFSGSNRTMTIDLSYNNFSAGTIRTMLTELLKIESSRKFTNVTIRLNNTKIDASGNYLNYSQEDIFPTSIQASPNQTISLTRTEKVKIYEVVKTIDANGVETLTPTVVGSKNITVPGQYISSLSGYYKTQTNGRQQIVESELGVKYKSRKYWTINLGFTYQSPNTTPTVTSTTYSDPVTREGSLGTMPKYILDGVTYYYGLGDLA